ncbi:hypothetical protein HLRTI_002898 [Halorhabdus tiamatea SARL4B]|uniref:Uncharacterized protein n=1 Tax=Halorhabdus tiamatea SARL4B TaxID=1033806 RepID=U2F9B8_9EURY|nr:hypothetical protein [Halorhabdus tiamatea]ERJ05099.1 hypothetical protein HLRTI_002898 [Halorhabdus tiamatea SARL4B]
MSPHKFTQTDDEQFDFESSIFGFDSPGTGQVESALPKDLLEELNISAEQAALTYPKWNAETLSLGFHIEFDDVAGPGIAGRQLHYNPTSEGVTIRFPGDLAKMTGLQRHVNTAKTRMKYAVDDATKTVDVEFDPPLTPPTTGDVEHPQLEERFKDSGFSPSRGSDGYLESIRYEVPVEYAREYGFEPQQPVGIEIVVVDGAFGIGIDLDPDPDDEYLLTRTLNSYTDEGPRSDLYAISIPKVAVHGLRWALDIPLRSIPQQDHIIVMPANPIGSIDETVERSALQDELIDESATA